MDFNKIAPITEAKAPEAPTAPKNEGVKSTLPGLVK